MPVVDPYLPIPDDGDPIPLGRPGTPIKVYKVTPIAAPVGGFATTSLEELTSVVCLGIEKFEGTSPPTAMFRYKFNGIDPDSPQTPEEALSTAVSSKDLKHLVEIGDLLGVKAFKPDGSSEWIFYGRPLTWSMTIDAHTSTVFMAATSLARDAWNTPVGGALMRDNAAPEVVKDVATDRVAQFNPRGRENGTPATADSGSGDRKYPVFMDINNRGTDTATGDYPRMFDLAEAVAHLMYKYNDEELIETPTRAALDALLFARIPKPGMAFDPADPSTYTKEFLQAPDVPLRGHPWPALVSDLIKNSGFGMRWLLTADSDDTPRHKLDLFLRQGETPKAVYLQERGTALDLSKTNMGRADLSRDLAGVVNRWVVRGALLRFEGSFILAPAFPSQASDSADAAALNIYKQVDAAFATSAAYNNYRKFVFDEAGDGHYAIASTTRVTKTATSLDAVLGAPDDAGVAQYVAISRPLIGHLFTNGPDGKPLKYRLSISTDYAGPYPGVWDGTGTWRHCNGGFRLLKDQIGIYISIEHPESWTIGQKGDGPFATGSVRVVSCMGNPDPAGTANAQKPKFYLRLTCVIEGDLALQGIAERADTSPVKEKITREIDASDRLFYYEQAKHSEFNNTADPVVIRDDSDLALAEATATRQATEAGVMEGSIIIPRFTTAYDVGDRISEIEGRNLGLRTDTGGSAYQPVLPAVVSVRWELDGKQMTILQISDAGLDRRRLGRKYVNPKASQTPRRERVTDPEEIRATFIKI